MPKLIDMENRFGEKINGNSGKNNLLKRGPER